MPCLCVWQSLSTLAASPVGTRTSPWWCLCWWKSWRCRSGQSRQARSALPRWSTNARPLVDEPLLHDKVAITRVPMQRVVEGPVPVREEHGTTIISVVEEVLVVEKRWMLREEIHIRSNASRRTSHNGSHYAAKTYRLSVYLTLMKIHKGEVVWQRHWSPYMTRSQTLSSVVQELIEDGFARSDIHLALDHTRSRVAHAASVEGDAAYEGAHLTETLGRPRRPV